MYFLPGREGSGCGLSSAARVKALPGRPGTDRPDSARPAGITGRGPLAASFVPPGDIRVLRTRTRCRRRLVQARTAGKARREKLPEDAHLKLAPVISGIHGVSGREMPTAIIAGQRDPRVPAQMARTRTRAGITPPEEAPDCPFFTREHAFILAMMPADTGHLAGQAQVTDDRTARLRRPCQRQIARLGTIPGSGITAARDLIAGTGAGMTVFPAAGRLCSRARYAPRVREPAGRRKGRSAAGRGSPCTGGTIGEAAASAGRTRTRPGARYRRHRTRMPEKKAQGAIGRTRLVITRALLPDPEAACQDPGAGCCERRADIRRDVRNHARAIERRGYRVILEPLTPDAEPIGPPITTAR